MSDDLLLTAGPPGGVLTPDCVLSPPDLDTGTCPIASEVGGDDGGLGNPDKPNGPKPGPPGNIKPTIKIKMLLNRTEKLFNMVLNQLGIAT